MNEDKIREWFLKNMRTHSDWTGTYVEYNCDCESVEEFIENFFNDIKEK